LVKAVYSLIMNGYWHRNIRAEHFVRCGKVWKLESLVLNDDYSKADGFSSEYLWSSKHQPPEFVSGKNYQDEEYNQMTVWNLGCILLHLFTSSHRLSNLDVIAKFMNKPFTFEAIGIKSDRTNKLSPATKELLGSLLHYDPNQRIKLSALF
jgi:serine/threonine protein kinase